MLRYICTNLVLPSLIYCLYIGQYIANIILVNSKAKTSPKSMKTFVKARLKSEPPSPPMDSGQRLNPKFNYLKTEIIYAGVVFIQFYPYEIYKL